MQVIALKSGFYNGRRYREGDEFSIPNGQLLGKWMTPVEEKPEPKAEKPKGAKQGAKGGADGLV